MNSEFKIKISLRDSSLLLQNQSEIKIFHMCTQKSFCLASFYLNCLTKCSMQQAMKWSFTWNSGAWLKILLPLCMLIFWHDSRISFIRSEVVVVKLTKQRVIPRFNLINRPLLRWFERTQKAKTQSWLFKLQLLASLGNCCIFRE